MTTVQRIPRSAPPHDIRPTSPSALNGETATDLVFYEPDTGRIVQTAGCGPQELPHFQLPGCLRLQAAADVLNDYVDLTGESPAVRPRPEISALDALPMPATVTVTCRTTGSVKSYAVGDGVFEYADLPGVYEIWVEAWPHHPTGFILEITP